MHRLRRVVAVLGVAVLAGAGLAGCGGGSSDATIVSVAGQSISKATLDHWVPIEAILARELNPTSPPPRGEVPDPPLYSACAAYLRVSTPNGTAIPTAQLKDKCAQRYARVRRHILSILITYDWLAAESAAQGVHVSDGEVKRELARFKRQTFPSEAAFQTYLKYTRERLADETLILKMDMVSTRLQKKFLAERGVSGLIKHRQEFPKQWAARTSCRSPYIVPDCKQYRGPLPPEATI
jgi:hypothetical protein